MADVIDLTDSPPLRPTLPMYPIPPTSRLDATSANLRPKGFSHSHAHNYYSGHKSHLPNGVQKAPQPYQQYPTPTVAFNRGNGLPLPTWSRDKVVRAIGFASLKDTHRALLKLTELSPALTRHVMQILAPHEPPQQVSSHKTLEEQYFRQQQSRLARKELEWVEGQIRAHGAMNWQAPPRSGLKTEPRVKTEGTPTFRSPHETQQFPSRATSSGFIQPSSHNSVPSRLSLGSEVKLERPASQQPASSSEQKKNSPWLGNPSVAWPGPPDSSRNFTNLSSPTPKSPTGEYALSVRPNPALDYSVRDRGLLKARGSYRIQEKFSEEDNSDQDSGVDEDSDDYGSSDRSASHMDSEASSLERRYAEGSHLNFSRSSSNGIKRPPNFSAGNTPMKRQRDY